VRVIRCSPWTFLVVVILADVAPSPSSCGSHSISDGYLQIEASNCACAPGTIRVVLDGRGVGTITCGSANAITVKAQIGRHVVAATNASASWADQSCDVRPDRTTFVELGCPVS
jgi:hypothetical protein